MFETFAQDTLGGPKNYCSRFGLVFKEHGANDYIETAEKSANRSSLQARFEPMPTELGSGLRYRSVSRGRRCASRERSRASSRSCSRDFFASTYKDFINRCLCWHFRSYLNDFKYSLSLTRVRAFILDGPDMLSSQLLHHICGVPHENITVANHHQTHRQQVLDTSLREQFYIRWLPLPSTEVLQNDVVPYEYIFLDYTGGQEVLADVQHLFDRQLLAPCCLLAVQGSQCGKVSLERLDDILTDACGRHNVCRERMLRMKYDNKVWPMWISSWKLWTAWEDKPQYQAWA